MDKHTPGPWRIERYSDTVTRDGDRIRASNNLIVVNEVWGASLAECDANYRLVAAAPDLLQALIDCITDDGAHCMGTNDPEKLKARIIAINSTALVALTKAIDIMDYDKLAEPTPAPGKPRQED
jgi:hypothetical protein